MNTIYVYGMPQCGLGNILFRFASAVYYCEKYNYKLVLVESNEILYGTSNLFGKIKCVSDEYGNYKPYTKTIFSKIETVNKLPEDDTYINIVNDYTDNKVIPDGRPILLHSYCQNVNLINEFLPKLTNYLDVNDQNIKDYIRKTYGDISNGVCLGVRIGGDFSHMKKITKSSYTTALNYYKTINVNTDTVYILSDTPGYTLDGYNCIEVNEPDIIQFYIGMMCKNYVLSESTFHLWIAYLGTCNDQTKNVICFNDTDITNRHLNLNSWIKISY